MNQLAITPKLRDEIVQARIVCGTEPRGIMR
jgi:hypothetical protein